MKSISLLSVLLLIACLSGCMMMAAKHSDPFEMQFEPIASLSGNKLEYLSKAVRILEEAGYSVTPNDAFSSATTLPKKIGIQRWRANGEKWHLEYQLSVQIIESNGSQLFWKLSHKIIGTRSGRQPRLFYPEDFDITENIVNEVHQKIIYAFREQA